jgi:hypothetical protein
MRTAPWWAIAIIYGVYFGVVMGVFFSFQNHLGWKLTVISGVVAGVLFGTYMVVTTTKRRDRMRAVVGQVSEDQLSDAYRSASKGPVPTDLEIREASNRLIKYRLAQTSRMKKSSYLVFGLFIVLGIYLVITSGPIWWLSVALFAGILGLTRWQSVRLGQRAALFDIDSTQLDAQGLPVLFDIGHIWEEGIPRSTQLVTVLITLRWWALTAGAVMAVLAVVRIENAHGNHGIGEAVLAVIFCGCSLWGFIEKARVCDRG